ncbi:permease [Crassaminicella indica]|uniref:Permease n=1 Tax=Crassaminicella indica TaxID=2855394 RepID=A0ABX8R8N2_9CLOT|nr:permease [Crassaminicella indica]QXM05382.1 permease [Crassaminicella indica]
MSLSLYVITIALLGISYYKDKNKTKKALKKSWKAFENILPQFLGVIVLVGIMLSIFNTEFISKVIGSESGWYGTLISAILGAITLIPGFVAFPTSAMLIENGAGYMQIGAFISALMMVGIITAPVEIKYFNKRLTIARNVLAFLFSFIVAFIIGKVV